VSRRYERGSLLTTSNRSVGAWGEVFGNPVVATTIVDRLLHHSHVVTIRGDSYRLREQRRAGLIEPTAFNRQPIALHRQPARPGDRGPTGAPLRQLYGKRFAPHAPPWTAPSPSTQGVNFSCRQGVSSGCRLIDGAEGFELLLSPLGGGTHAWRNRNRCPVKDFKAPLKSATARLQLASVSLCSGASQSLGFHQEHYESDS
jgi:hypothetical protein